MFPTSWGFKFWWKENIRLQLIYGKAQSSLLFSRTTGAKNWVSQSDFAKMIHFQLKIKKFFTPKQVTLFYKLFFKLHNFFKINPNPPILWHKKSIVVNYPLNSKIVTVFWRYGSFQIWLKVESFQIYAISHSIWVCLICHNSHHDTITNDIALALKLKVKVWVNHFNLNWKLPTLHLIPEWVSVWKHCSKQCL